MTPIKAGTIAAGRARYLAVTGDREARINVHELDERLAAERVAQHMSESSPQEAAMNDGRALYYNASNRQEEGER